MIKVLVIAGVTASGKSRLGVELAKQFNGEIISADSVAVYRELDIGSAKPSLIEQDGVVHHMIDVLDLDESFNVARFQKEARDLIDSIHQRNKLPIIVGGTGLYINALLYDYRFDEEEDLIEPMEGSNQELHDQLSLLHQDIARTIHPNNRKRVIRALQRGGQPEVEFDSNTALYDALVYFLEGDRKQLYERMDHRVELMVGNGLVEEIEKLNSKYPEFFEYQATQCIGYREFKEFVSGSQSIERTIELIQRNTRRFSKRQITWFKHQTKCQHIDIFKVDFKAEILKEVSEWIS